MRRVRFGDTLLENCLATVRRPYHRSGNYREFGQLTRLSMTSIGE